MNNLPSANKYHYGYTIVMCCFLIMFINVGLIMSSAGIFYKPVTTDLGIDVGKFGFYMSFNFIFSTLTLSFAGKIFEKYSARVLLTICSAIAGITLAVMSLFSAVWHFYVAGTIFGITFAFLLYLGFPTLLNRWFKARMGLFIGICSAGSGIGGVLFNPIGGYLITNYGWRTTYLIFGLIILVFATPFLGFFLRDYPKDMGQEPYGVTAESKALVTKKKSDIENGLEYSHAVKMPIFYGIVIFAFLMNATATLNTFIPAYIQDIKFTVEQASFVASAVMVGVTVGKVLLGLINDQNSTWGVLTTTGLGILGLLLLLLLGHYSIYISIVGGFFFGWAYAGVTVQTPLLVRIVFGNKNYAQIYGNVSMAFAVGGAIAAGGWGLLSDIKGFGFILWLGIAFLIVSCAIGLYALKTNNR